MHQLWGEGNWNYLYEVRPCLLLWIMRGELLPDLQHGEYWCAASFMNFFCVKIIWLGEFYFGWLCKVASVSNFCSLSFIIVYGVITLKSDKINLKSDKIRLLSFQKVLILFLTLGWACSSGLPSSKKSRPFCANSAEEPNANNKMKTTTQSCPTLSKACTQTGSLRTSWQCSGPASA